MNVKVIERCGKCPYFLKIGELKYCQYYRCWFDDPEEKPDFCRLRAIVLKFEEGKTNGSKRI